MAVEHPTSEVIAAKVPTRVPRLPVEYETAIKSLAACITIDEAKYWSDKAEALAAWAKIYHSNEAKRKAAALKLHAFRRIGKIADELRPRKKIPGTHGSGLGASSLLRENGFSASTAAIIRRISIIPKDTFEQAISRPTPPSPHAFVRNLNETDPGWARTRHSLFACRAFMRTKLPYDVAQTVGVGQVATLRELATEVSEWLDSLDRHLEKLK